MIEILVGHAVAAVLLALAGSVFWTAGRAERRLADLHHQLLTLQHSTVAAEESEFESSLGPVARAPWVGASMVNDARRQRAIALYWLERYPGLQPQKDAAGAVVERDPDLLFLAANAAYRASQHGPADKASTVRRLESVMNEYAEVLKSTPGHVDAAYNYEYVTRLRDLAARPGRGTNTDHDEPWGEPTLHGWPGAPPSGPNMGKFKVVMPRRGDERNDEDDVTPGTGAAKRRRG